MYIITLIFQQLYMIFKAHFHLVDGDNWQFLEHSWGGFVEHLSKTCAAQQSVTKIIYLIFINLVTPKAAAKRELLFNKPASVFSKDSLKVAN